MGLDMYLTAQRSLADYDFAPKEKELSKKVYDVLGVNDIVERDNSVTIDIPVGYWCKANSIHRWFVENVQDGVDDCQKSYVSEENLNKLLSVCEQVQEDHSLAPELLPTRDGFFFGGTAYDEYYFKDIEYTLAILTKVIGFINAPNGEVLDIYYQASW